MKAITIIFITFLIAFLTTTLLEINFITSNPVRYILVVLLVIIELVFGLIYLRHEIKTFNNV